MADEEKEAEDRPFVFPVGANDDDSVDESAMNLKPQKPTMGGLIQVSSGYHQE